MSNDDEAFSSSLLLFSCRCFFAADADDKAVVAFLEVMTKDLLQNFRLPELAREIARMKSYRGEAREEEGGLLVDCGLRARRSALAKAVLLATSLCVTRKNWTETIFLVSRRLMS